MTECRVCRQPIDGLILDLGSVPLANALVSPEATSEPEPQFPLGIQFCPNCAIVQLAETVEPEILFRHYLYTPSASTTWLEHCAELSAWVRAGTDVDDSTLVVEPASNDGALLRAIQGWAPRILGVEPALNIAEAAVADGIPTLPEFFSEATARRIREEYGPAAVVVGTNVLAHVPDIVDFLKGAAALIEPDGLVVVEAPYLRDLVESLAYDTIYHEHVSYLSVTALVNAYRLAGLELTHVERTPVHGGSIRFAGRPLGATPDPTVQSFLADEEELGYADGRALSGFAERVADLRRRLKETIVATRASGQTIAAYGATAKGNTLLTTCGITLAEIDYIVDRNPLKQGHLAPGTQIPIVDAGELERRPVDVLLVLAWNLKDEVIAQQRAFAVQGGRFLIPIPAPYFA
jgi:hypothetical protein